MRKKKANPRTFTDRYLVQECTLDSSHKLHPLCYLKLRAVHSISPLNVMDTSK